MRYEIRPLRAWLESVTVDRRRGTFRAPWSATLKLLQRETELLGAGLVVIQLDVTEASIRRDGMLYARTRLDFPGVRVSFTSDYGPLTYSTDRFDAWQTNVRAIALSLQSLRAVDRYGVTRRGEQYRGWQAIASTAAGMTPKAAQALLDSYGGLREAIKATHPDRPGGNRTAFEQVQEARHVLDL